MNYLLINNINSIKETEPQTNQETYIETRNKKTFYRQLQLLIHPDKVGGACNEATQIANNLLKKKKTGNEYVDFSLVPDDVTDRQTKYRCTPSQGGTVSGS